MERRPPRQERLAGPEAGQVRPELTRRVAARSGRPRPRRETSAANERQASLGEAHEDAHPAFRCRITRAAHDPMSIRGPGHQGFPRTVSPLPGPVRSRRVAGAVTWCACRPGRAFRDSLDVPEACIGPSSGRARRRRECRRAFSAARVPGAPARAIACAAPSRRQAGRPDRIAAGRPARRMPAQYSRDVFVTNCAA